MQAPPAAVVDGQGGLERLTVDGFAGQYDPERPIRYGHHAEKVRAARRALARHDQRGDRRALRLDDVEAGLPDRLVAADFCQDRIAAADLRLPVDAEQARTVVQERSVLDVEGLKADLLDRWRCADVAERARLIRDVEHLALRQEGRTQAERDYKSHDPEVCKVRTSCVAGVRGGRETATRSEPRLAASQHCR